MSLFVTVTAVYAEDGGAGGSDEPVTYTSVEEAGSALKISGGEPLRRHPISETQPLYQKPVSETQPLGKAHEGAEQAKRKPQIQPLKGFSKK